MLKPRTRLLSLRMTEEEYDRLRDASAGQGARSVSEFARNALLTTSDPEPIAHYRDEALSTLDERMTKVENDVAQVRNELSSYLSSQKGKPIT